MPNRQQVFFYDTDVNLLMQIRQNFFKKLKTFLDFLPPASGSKSVIEIR